MMDSKTFYQNRLEALSSRLKKLQKKKSIFGYLRFGTIVATFAIFYYLWAISLAWVFIAGILLLSLFVRLVYRDLANKDAIQHTEHLINISEDEIKALVGDQKHFQGGASYLPKDHLYASDIDVFGQASLFQFFNRTSSEMGAAQLASWFSAPANAEEIIGRQESIRELKEKMDWRHNLQAYGRAAAIKMNTLHRLKSWSTEKTIFLQFSHWKWLRYLLPAICLMVIIGAIFGWISMNALYITLFLFAVIAYQVNKYVSPVHEKLSKIVDELDTLTLSIHAIEKEKFISPLAIQLQKTFISNSGKASLKTRRLNKILDRLDIRYNIVMSLPLNIILLWNLQQVIDLEKWKTDHAAELESWFFALGSFEALNSMAAIHFNHPDWCFPELHAEHFYIESEKLGHPLINESKRVDNFIDIKNRGDIMLVTGSNMAGKSTYLRSVGVNIVLAMAGAPVCAKKFKLSPVQLISSMRIADNLEESTSTFYAELKKLKTIINLVNNGEKVFILLDEILRGTNSLDRHTGSVALIQQLIRQNASAILATHDLELAKLEADYPENILNFHFDVQVNNEELYFDYRLKPGVCTSLNASILMKKIGIEL